MTIDFDNYVPSSYLGIRVGFIPILKQVLVDPIPGVRSTASKALGTLTRGLGEEFPSFPEFLAWLLETMSGDTSSVERSGGAQGFVNVAVALEEDERAVSGQAAADV